MTSHIYRVTVRGHFADLDEDRRRALLDEVEDHTVFRSAYTAAGTFTYQPDLAAFSLRYEVRARGEDPASTAEGSARAVAEGFLADAGLGFKHLRVTVVDMADVWDR